MQAQVLPTPLSYSSLCILIWRHSDDVNKPLSVFLFLFCQPNLQPHAQEHRIIKGKKVKFFLPYCSPNYMTFCKMTKLWR